MTSPPYPLQIRRRPLLLHGEQIRYAPGWEPRLRAAGIRTGGAWTGLRAGEVVSASPLTNAFRIVLDDGETVYFKRYVYRDRPDRFYWLVPSKAIIEAWAYGQFAGLGIPTIEPVAVGEIRRFGRAMAAFIVTREEPAASSLETYAAREWAGLHPDDRWREAQAVADALIPQLRKAHRAGVYHHDLKWRNVLVKRRDDRYETYWIDAPRARRGRPDADRGRLVDLGALARLVTAYVGPRRQIRLLARYLDEPPSSPVVRRWVERIRRYLSRRLPEHLKR